MYQFQYDHVKPKYDEKAKLCVMYRQFHCVQKNNDIYKDVVEENETRFDTSSYGLERQLAKVQNEKAIGLINGELSRKKITKFVGLRAKTFSYLIDAGSENRKMKRNKISITKKKSNLNII